MAVVDRVIVPNLDVTTTIVVDGSFTPSTGTVTNAKLTTSPEISRSKLEQTQLAVYPIPLTSWRQHDNILAIPTSAANDDLTITGTFGSEGPHLSAGDVSASVTANTRYLRAMVDIPMEYDAGETITIRVWAGMQTAIADRSCTVDIECYRLDLDGTPGASDLCNTAAQSMNSTVFASYDFTITPTGVVAGDIFDVRLGIAYEDVGTVGAVEPSVSATDLLCDIKG